ncbi:MAG: hypothetical protein IKX71_02475 [Bacteroidales bacterium]|nr:hypothetical protein [Bacteroidales bacterium]
MSTPKQTKKVIHLTIKDGDQHSYYGSVACIFEHFSEDEIGIKYRSLRNYVISETHPYENQKVIIRQGRLLTKEKKEKME